MNKHFHNDVDKENLDIANKIFEDSHNISCGQAKDINEILDSKKKSNKSKYIFSTCAVAACVALLIGISFFYNNSLNNTAFQPKTKLSKNVSKTNSENIRVASNYDEVYEHLLKADKDNEIYYSIYDDTISEESAGSTNLKASPNDSFDYYETNEQTEDVHEGDIVKTNGEYIYTLSYDYEWDYENNEEPDTLYSLYISKVNGTKVKNISTIDFQTYYKDGNNSCEEYMNELYYYNDKIIVIGSKNTEVSSKSSDSEDIVYEYLYETVIYTYDVSNPKQPKLISTNVQDGYYTSSRMIGNYLYSISEKRIYDVQNVSYYDYIPSVNGSKITCGCIYLPSTINDEKFSVITALDVEKSADFASSISVVGGSDIVYASQDNLYLINNTYSEKEITDKKEIKKAFENFDYWNLEEKDLNKQLKPDEDMIAYIKQEYPNVDADNVYYIAQKYLYTSANSLEIIKYTYDNGNVNFVADNIVRGNSYDNLYFDEKDGYLRFVSTENSSKIKAIKYNYYDKDGNLLFDFSDTYEFYDETGDTNNVYVLDKNLNEVALIDSLAKDETIYSARYLGDYGYFVTYEETDPLFSVDFSDIENPKIIGELKMPGYSSYLHFYSEDLLFGLGVMENDNTSDDLKLEMYSLKDGVASQKSKLVIDNLSDSQALDDYKALMIDSEKNLIGFSAADYGIDYEKDDYYYVVYSYENDKFIEKIKIEIKDNWCDIRGLYINNYLYIIQADEGIYALDMDTYANNKKVEYEKFE